MNPFYNKDKKKIEECNKQAIMAGFKGVAISIPIAYGGIFYFARKSNCFFFPLKNNLNPFSAQNNLQSPSF